MPVINKPPQIVERKYQLEDLVADAAEQYAGWIGSTADHVVNSAVEDDALARQGLPGLAEVSRRIA